MRHQRIQTRTSGGARWWNLSLPVAITAVAVWATPAQARPGVGFGGGSGDAVGSLPSEYGGGPGTGEHGVLDPVVDQFRLVLIGDAAQLDALVLEARKSSANAWLTEELLGNGLKRVVYGGDVALTIDRSVLESSFVAVQLELGPIFGGGALAISSGNGTVARTAAVPGTLPVHLQQLSSAASDLLDAGVELRATTKAGKQRALSAVSDGPDSGKLKLKLGN